MLSGRRRNQVPEAHSLHSFRNAFTTMTQYSPRSRGCQFLGAPEDALQSAAHAAPGRRCEASPVDRRVPLPGHLQARIRRAGGQQLLRVWMLGSGEDLVDRAHLDEAPFMHDRHPVANLAHNPNVM